MAGWLWPIVAHIWPEVKSRYSRPSLSVTTVPLADLNSFGNASPPYLTRNSLDACRSVSLIFLSAVGPPDHSREEFE